MILVVLCEYKNEISKFSEISFEMKLPMQWKNTKVFCHLTPIQIFFTAF